MPSNRRYEILWENDEPVAFEVDGKSYPSLLDVPDGAERDALAAMLDEGCPPADDDALDDPSIDGLRDLPPDVESHVPGVPVERIVAGVFAGVAVVLLLVSAITAWFAAARFDRELLASGRVVDVVESHYASHTGNRVEYTQYVPVVEFASADGRLHRAHLEDEAASRPEYEVGDTVALRYDRTHPLDVRRDSAGGISGGFIAPGVTGLLALIFGSVSVGIFYVTRKRD